jgi:hypothetical protein
VEGLPSEGFIGLTAKGRRNCRNCHNCRNYRKHLSERSSPDHVTKVRTPRPSHVGRKM